MRVQAFSLFITLLGVAEARPILLSGFHFNREDTALNASSETPISNVTDVPTVAVSVTDSSLPSATIAISVNPDAANVTISAANSAVFPTATDTDAATPTDSSSPDIASSALPTDSPSVTDPADVAASATDSDVTASTTDFAFPTTIPVSPPACAAKAADLPPPPSGTSTVNSTDTSPATDPPNSSTADPAVSTAPSDTTGGNATEPASAVFPSASALPSATDSAISASATGNTTITDPFTSVNSTQNVSKRIAQPDLPDVAQAWQNLCLVSGGDIFTNEPCVQLAGIDGINALLADSDPCAQQDNADAMIDFAKSPGVTNTDALIQNAIAFRKHPRNALNVLGVTPSTPFCQKAPRNQELVGVVNDQLSGVDPGIFGGPQFGLVAFGDDGTCPFGTTPDVNSCSCV